MKGLCKLRKRVYEDLVAHVNGPGVTAGQEVSLKVLASTKGDC